jgi:hypothetical protein
MEQGWSESVDRLAEYVHIQRIPAAPA